MMTNIKNRILTFSLASSILFIIGFFLHPTLVNEKILHFSISTLYVFLFASSNLVYFLIELVFNKIPNQTGFAFLAMVFIKIGVFTLLFKSALLSEVPMQMPEKLSIIVPFFTFLLLESAFSFKLLNES